MIFPKASSSRPLTFQAHFDRAMRQMQSSLTKVLASLEADPSRPQELARRFGLNKNLAWKISRIVSATDVLATARHVPGASGFKIALGAFEAGGASRNSLAEVREAQEEYENMVRLHAGNRQSLELLLGSLLPGENYAEARESSRRLSYQGNSAIWGVQSRIRFNASIVAPNVAGDGTVDVGSVGGVMGFRRLRPTGVWPLLSTGGYGGSSEYTPVDQMSQAGEGPPLMPEFCSGNLPEIRSIPRADRTYFELGEGPVGNAASMDCVFGWTRRRFASIYAEDDKENTPIAEFFVKVDAPSELLQFDLLVHRDLPIEKEPRVFLYSLMQGDIQYPLSQQDRNLMPCEEPLRALGFGAPVLTTPHIASYPRMVDKVLDRMNCKLDEFRGYRFLMSYPPIPTYVVLTYPLAHR